MKLYFYILKTEYNRKPYIQFEECEVKETPKTYKPVSKFPCGIYRSYVNKSDIGHISGYSNNCIILKEKNNQFAKNMFAEMIKRTIKSKNNEIEKLKEKLNAVYEFENEDCPRDCPYFANGEECKADKCVIELVNRKGCEADVNDD